MKPLHQLTVSLLLGFWSAASANPLIILSGNANNGVTPAAYLIDESYEGTGYVNSWTETAGTINEDYTTSPIVGSQSLYITGSSVATYVSFTAQDTVYVFARIRFQSIDAANRNLASIRDSSGTALASFGIGSGGQARATSAGGTANSSSGTFTTGNNYYFWMEYEKGTGANAVTRIGWSSDGTKPTLTASGANSAVSSNGTTTAQGARFYWGTTASNVFEIVADHTLISSTVIGNNP